MARQKDTRKGRKNLFTKIIDPSIDGIREFFTKFEAHQRGEDVGRGYGVPGLTLVGKYNQAVRDWLITQTPFLTDPKTTLVERAFNLLRPDDVELVCSYGNKKRFDRWEIGYRCKPRCPCHRNEHSEFMKNMWTNRTEKETKSVFDKRANTLFQLYGTTNHMEVPHIVSKIENTNLNRLGVSMPFLSTIVQQKAENTTFQNHGVRKAFQSPIIQQKAKDTFSKNYPHLTDVMQLARDAYYQQTGYKNPFQNPEVIAKIDEIMMRRYGVRKALQCPKIYSRMQDNLEKKFGYRNAGHIPEGIEKSKRTSMQKYGRANLSQVHISTETLSLLNNKAEFEDFMKHHSMSQAASRLGVHYSTIKRTFDKHGIQRPISSEERALRTFVSETGFAFIPNSRSYLSPSEKEIDIYIEDLSMGIEHHGLFDHSTSQWRSVDSSAHIEKLNLANNNGIRLIQVFQDEYNDKKSVVENRLRNAMGILHPFDWQHFRFGKISRDIAKDFLDEYHLENYEPNASHSYGAFDLDGLKAVISFYHDTNETEILRFAVDHGNDFHVSYPGLFETMVDLFRQEHSPSVIAAYANRMWSEGFGLFTAGFVFEDITDIERFDVDLNRAKRRKSDIELSGKQFASIWDCGKIKTRKIY